jgi:hypothetical protein
MLRGYQQETSIRYMVFYYLHILVFIHRLLLLLLWLIERLSVSVAAGARATPVILIMIRIVLRALSLRAEVKLPATVLTARRPASAIEGTGVVRNITIIWAG